MNFIRRRGGRAASAHTSAGEGFRCGGCGAWHSQLPMAFHIQGPDAWSRKLKRVKGCELGSDQCVIRDEEFFVRGLICVPVAGLEEPFEFGVWVSLTEEDIMRMTDAWYTPGRETWMPPLPGQLANNIVSFDEPTLGLRVLLHTREVGLRPHIEVIDDGHPLAAEQREGISHEALVQRVGQLLHVA